MLRIVFSTSFFEQKKKKRNLQFKTHFDTLIILPYKHTTDKECIAEHASYNPSVEKKI